MKWHTIAVRVTEDHFNSISKLASANEQSVGAWCKLVLLAQMQGLNADRLAAVHMDRLMHATKKYGGHE